MWTRRVLLVGLLLGVMALAVVPRVLFRLEHRPPRPGVSAPAHSAGDLYARHFPNARHERMFLASIAFFLAFAVARVITHLIRAGRGPFHDVVTRGGHSWHSSRIACSPGKPRSCRR